MNEIRAVSQWLQRDRDFRPKNTRPAQGAGLFHSQQISPFSIRQVRENLVTRPLISCRMAETASPTLILIASTEPHRVGSHGHDAGHHTLLHLQGGPADPPQAPTELMTRSSVRIISVAGR
jgi:hypothetical protein